MHWEFLLPLFQNECWCTPIHIRQSFSCMFIVFSLPPERLCTRTRFETETKSNSERAYSHSKKIVENNQRNCNVIPSVASSLSFASFLAYLQRCFHVVQSKPIAPSKHHKVPRVLRNAESQNLKE